MNFSGWIFDTGKNFYFIFVYESFLLLFPFLEVFFSMFLRQFRNRPVNSMYTWPISMYIIGHGMTGQRLHLCRNCDFFSIPSLKCSQIFAYAFLKREWGPPIQFFNSYYMGRSRPEAWKRFLETLIPVCQKSQWKNHSYPGFWNSSSRS